MKYGQQDSAGGATNSGGLLVRAGQGARFLVWPAIGAFFVTLVATIARLLGPLVVRDGLDDGVAASDEMIVARAGLAFIALLVLQYVAQRISQKAVSWVGEQFLLRLRSRVYAHILSLDMAFFDRSKTGVLVSRMTSDIEALTDFVNEGAVTALTNILTSIGVAIALLVVDVQLALVVFALIGVLMILTILFQYYVSLAYGRVRERIAAVLATLQEGIDRVREVQAFTQYPQQSGTFGRVNESYFEANMQAARAISWFFPSVSVLHTAGIGLVLFVGGRRVIEGDLTFGSLVAFLLLLEWFFQPIVGLVQVSNLLQASLAALKKIVGILDTQPALVQSSTAYDLPEHASGSLRLCDVSFSYSGSGLVLDRMDLDIPAGQRVAIVGETGAGKSTVAKLLMRLYDPTEGLVRVDGHDLRDLTNESRSRFFTLIPQDDYLFNGTLRENFIYGNRESTDRDIWRVCSSMGIDEWVQMLPNGLDTNVRQHGSRFSAGERQLIALGRAFLIDPAVIVLDEATSNLDPETEVQVEGALRVLLSGRTAVVIAHRLRSAERADRVVFLHGGRVIGDDTHIGLVNRNPRYRELVRVWERGLA